MSRMKKPSGTRNKVISYIETEGDPDEKIKTIFGDINYATELSSAFRTDKKPDGSLNPLISFINDNIDRLLDWVLTEKEEFKSQPNSEMIIKNINAGITSGSLALRKSLCLNDTFQERIARFIYSEYITDKTTTSWGRIVSSLFLLSLKDRKIGFITDDNNIKPILNAILSRPDLLGYRYIIQVMLDQNIYKNLFVEVSKAAAENIREYQFYLNLSQIESDDDIEISGNDDTQKDLLMRTYYLLKLFSTTYTEAGELKISGHYDEIIRNLLSSMPLFFEIGKSKFPELEKLVIDSAVTDISLLMDIMPADSEVRLLSSKLIKQTGMRFYDKHLEGIEITPDMPNSEIEKLEMVIRTFPAFWEAGINRLTPLLFRTFGKTKQEGDNDFTKNSMVPGKIGHTIIDKISKWILSIKKDDDKERTQKKLFKFIRANSVVQYICEYFPRDRLKEGTGPSLNPFILSIAELLSYGYVKFENSFDGDSTQLKPRAIMMDGTVEAMENDEYSKFIVEELAPISDEFQERIREGLFY